MVLLLGSGTEAAAQVGSPASGGGNNEPKKEFFVEQSRVFAAERLRSGGRAETVNVEKQASRPPSTGAPGSAGIRTSPRAQARSGARIRAAREGTTGRNSGKRPVDKP